MHQIGGLTKEEKIAKFNEVRDKYRVRKQRNIVKTKLDKEKRRREGIKKAQEAERREKIMSGECFSLLNKEKREKRES